jgi:hypothetical protein
MAEVEIEEMTKSFTKAVPVNHLLVYEPHQNKRTLMMKIISRDSFDF